MNDFKRLFDVLKISVEEAAKDEISEMKKNPDQTEENFSENKELALNLFRITIHIFGSKGEYFLEESPEIFDEGSLPDNITRIIFDNTTRFSTLFQQKEPKHKLKLEFDFNKAVVFDLLSLPSAPTRNNSNMSISSQNDIWAAGTYNKIIEFLKTKKNRHGWIHKRNIYDIFLFILIFPLSLRLLYVGTRFLPVKFFTLPSFFKTVCFFYFFLLIVNIFRIMFNYARWLFPIVELQSEAINKAMKHRRLIATVISVLFFAAIYDLFKLVFKFFFS
jgi:hypothetical protein